jgi:hypothetical protein
VIGELEQRRHGVQAHDRNLRHIDYG